MITFEIPGPPSTLKNAPTCNRLKLLRKVTGTMGTPTPVTGSATKPAGAVGAAKVDSGELVTVGTSTPLARASCTATHPGCDGPYSAP